MRAHCVILASLLAVLASLPVAWSAEGKPATADADGENIGAEMLADFDKTLTASHRQVGESIGRILLAKESGWLEEDSLPGEPALIEMVFEREYQKIRRLPVESRIQFFWVLIPHFKIGQYTHLSEEFAETMAKDCGKEMDQALAKVIAASEKRGESKDDEVKAAENWRRALAMFRRDSEKMIGASALPGKHK
jgi:hypothetical protein